MGSKAEPGVSLMWEYLTALLWLSGGVTALQCIQCTSDPSAPNMECIGDENGTMAADLVQVDCRLIMRSSIESCLQGYSRTCDPQYGDEFCYTMITAEPADVLDNDK